MGNSKTSKGLCRGIQVEVRSLGHCDKGDRKRGPKGEIHERASMGYDGHVASVVAQDSTGLTLLNPHNNFVRRYPLSQL